MNFDQTSLGFAIPLIENYIYKKELPKFPIAISDDKRQITGAFTVNLLGYFLPILLVYTGTTGLCHPKVKFLSEFDITHLLNHCSNEELVISLLKKIVIPFIWKKREALKSAEDSKALLIFDMFKSQTTGAVNKLLKDYHWLMQYVPINHNNLFQPWDISVNKGAKSFLSNKYQDWHGLLNHQPRPQRIFSLLEEGEKFHAEWVTDYHKDMFFCSKKAAFKKERFASF